jgi:hypothetical protein
MTTKRQDAGDLVREALLSLDTEILNVDRISMLIGGVTESSELEAIKVREGSCFVSPPCVTRPPEVDLQINFSHRNGPQTQQTLLTT